MKEDQLRGTEDTIEKYAGYMRASTWLQCVADEGVGGPFTPPGGMAEDLAIDTDVTIVQKDAGILRWLQAIKAKYGAWTPAPAQAPAG